MRRNDKEEVVVKGSIEVQDRGEYMYSGINKVERSKEYLIDAIQAAKDKEKSRFFPEGLSLVGVNLDSDFLKMSQVLAEPQLTISLDDDVGITINITLKPENQEDPIMDILSLAFDSTSTGMFMGGGKLSSEDEKDKEELAKLSSLMVAKGAADFNEDPEVMLFFSEDSVRLQRFKLLGEEYYAFSLTEEADIAGEPYKHTLNAVFKEKSSSHETFLSAFVGEKLHKRETLRLFESISQNNITGFFIGGISMKSPELEVLTYAMSSTLMNYTQETEMLSIRTGDSTFLVDVDKLQRTEVKVNEAGKYIIILGMVGNKELHIYMG